MTARFTYQRLVELVEGDTELIHRLVEDGVIATVDETRVLVDIDRVLVARTLYRDLEIEWSGIEVILRLCDELGSARRRIAELERQLASR